MRFLLLNLCFFVLLFSSCAVKKPCTLKLEQAPELRGLKLGMTLQEIQKKYPNVPPSREVGYGKSFLSIETVKYPELKDVKYLELELVDEKIVKISAYYPKDLNWKAEELSKRTAEVMKLDGDWEKSSSLEYRSMYCGVIPDAFAVRVGIGTRALDTEGLPYVELENHWESFKPNSRRIDAEKEANRKMEEQKQVFKP